MGEPGSIVTFYKAQEFEIEESSFGYIPVVDTYVWRFFGMRDLNFDPYLRVITHACVSLKKIEIEEIY